jgi:hypothetical protein
MDKSLSFFHPFQANHKRFGSKIDPSTYLADHNWHNTAYERISKE